MKCLFDRVIREASRRNLVKLSFKVLCCRLKRVYMSVVIKMNETLGMAKYKKPGKVSNIKRTGVIVGNFEKSPQEILFCGRG